MFYNHPYVYGVIGFITPLLSIVSPHALVIPLILLIFINIPSYSKEQYLALATTRLGKAFLAIFSFGLLSSFWAVNPKLSVILSFKLFFFGLFASLWWTTFPKLEEKKQTILLSSFKIGIITAILGCFLESSFNYPLTSFAQKSLSKGVGNAAMYLSMAIWIFYKRSWLFAFFVFITYKIFTKLGTDTALVGLFIGFIFSLIYPFIQKLRYTHTSILALFLGVTFLTPWVSLKFDNNTAQWLARLTKDTSHVHRIFILKNTAEEIAKKPILGHGLDNARTFPKIIDQHDFCPQENKCEPLYGDRFGLHPHNAPTQWWLELGLIGVLLISYFFYRIFKQFSKFDLSKQQVT
ncbi:MAG TPA: O-antigen ligase family protein, partial [Alphaproteobacteria bacterium]|nr:O-antigen ligase family protein [Alphaproteobacteria bacterium]